MSIFKSKHKHDWEYIPEYYSPTAIRRCRACLVTQFWREAHYGTWEITKNHGEKNGKTLDKTILWWYDSR